MAPRPIALTLPLALALLSACQLTPTGAPPFLTPTFRIQAAGGDAAAPGHATGVPVEGATTVRVAPPADDAVVPVYDGKLTVRFGHLLGKAERRLLATIADVDKITIKLSGNGVNHTETISKAMITGGMTSFTFAGLPAGALTVTIQALDAGGAVIGQDIQQATVTAGQTTTVTSTVRLDPPSPSPRAIVAGGSGGSGGSGGTAGGLTTDITLVEGSPVISPPVEGVYPPPLDPNFTLNRIALGRDGKLWVYQYGNYLYSVDAAGQYSPVIGNGLRDSMSVETYEIDASDPSGRVFLLTTDMLGIHGSDHVVSPDGHISDWYLNDVVAGVFRGPIEDLEADEQGRIWGIGTQELRRFADDWGTEPGTRYHTYAERHPIPGGGHRLKIDQAGNFWVATYNGTVSSYDAGVSKRFSVAFPEGLGLDLALDSQGNAWVVLPAQRAVAKIASDGTLIGTFPTAGKPTRLFIDANDHVWAFPEFGTTRDLISRFGPDGTLLAHYAIGGAANDYLLGMVVTPQGKLWASTSNEGLVRLGIPPLPSPGP